ncbi:chemotaxis protein CheX [bacterium]|nr:chemotaxis protein CheX [bacterium]
MKAEYINPFISSTVNVLQTMASTEVRGGKPSRKEGDLTRGELNGLIGMAGTQVSGNMTLSFEQQTILSIVSKMLMEEFTELNEDVEDAVGELTNMITGGVKKLLNENGHSFEMATPMIIKGKGVSIKQFSESPVLSIEFECDSGKFWIEANLAPTK